MILCFQVMSARIHPAKGTVNYAPEMVPRTPIERTMGIFNALTTVLFAYGAWRLFAAAAALVKKPSP
jgi:hypothetical protein